MAQNTNLNIAPYFDDFDSDKGFLKVLFKPGYPVQARELTTLQSLLQNQIDSFGQGVYKEGSVVVPGGITLSKEVPVLIVQNTYLNLDVELYREALSGKVIKGSTSGVRARVNFSISAATSTIGNISFYLTYLQKANDNETSTFTDGEIITCESDITYASTTISAGTPIAQLLNANSNSKGSTANVSQGVYFVRGYFVPVLQQTILLDQYGTNPSYKVGLKVEERIITADEDESLYDNAIGSTNFSAPGADRFKINLTLVKKQLTDPNSADFIELVRTNEGKVQKKVERSELGFISEVLATRTKEESGDYYVKKFSIDARENLSDGFNDGVYTSGATTQDGNTPSEANIAVQTSAGTAYVSGFRVERLSTSYKDVEKPREYIGVDNQSITSDFGNYVLMTNAHQAPSIYSVVDLRDETNTTPGTPNGTVIGQARVLNFDYESGTKNTATTIYRLNVADTQIFTKITTTGSVTWNSGDYLVGATSGATGYIYSGSGTTGYLYGTSGTFVAGETLNQNGVTSFATVASNGVYQYSFGDVKSITNSGGFTSDIVLDVRVSLPGSGPIISGHSAGNATVTATLSNYVSQLRVNDIVEFSNNNASHRAKVTAITSNYVFTITRLGSTTLANGAITGNITRTRPEIKETTKRRLITGLGYEAVKNTNKDNTINPAGYFRQSYTGVSVSGGTFSLNAGTGLQFRDPGDGDDFKVIVTAGTGDGDILEEGTDFTVSGTGTQSSVTVSALNTGVTTVDVIATVYKSDRSAKAKTTERMKILKIDKTTGSSANGLTQSTADYGYRVEDNAISLGCGDVFKIKAIIESTDSSDPVLPRFQYTNLVGTISIDDVITGDTSGSRARVVSTDSNFVYYIPVEDDVFSDGENITAPAATFKIVTGSIISGGKDITDNYDLDDGQRDQFYDYSRIVRKSGYSAPTHRILVIFDRFLTTSGTGFYSVDSYPSEDYKIIPQYAGTQLRDVLDFRPMVVERLSGSGTRTSPYTLSVTNMFDFGSRAFTGNQVGLPGQSGTTILSLEYYLGRVDKVYINKDNKILVVKGASAANPTEPEGVEDAMLLATLTYKPYVFNVEDDITIKETNYKRYTFRDIQTLEDRIKTLEYYTQLSLLESETASMQITDTSGLNRFKNGFIVDNFASLSTSDTLHPDYRVSVDFEEGQLRPSHYTTQVPLTYATASQNVKVNGDIVTLPYTDALLLDQPYASGVENVNPFNVFTYVGDIKLYPESDNWVDTKSLSPLKGPTVEGNFLTTVREYNADQNGFAPIQWNAWKTTWTGTSTSTSVGGWRGGGGKGRQQQNRTITTTTTTTTKQTRTGIRYRVTPVIEQQSLGNRVVSVENIQLMRSRNIEFVVQKVKPRTKFFAFFDGIALPKELVTPKVMGLVKNPSTDSKTNSIPFQIGETVYVKNANGKFRFKAKVSAPNAGFSINPITGDDISTVNDYTANLAFINIDTHSLADQAKGSYYGSPKINDYIVGETSGAIAKVSSKDLVSDQKGQLTGSFFIPSPTGDNKKFKTGSRLFRLTDDAADSKVIGVSDSNAEAEFTSSGILQTTQETIISVRNAKITSEDLVQNRTLVSSSSSSREETRFVDPLAQTFLVEDSSLEGGVFLTKIDIFFYQKDDEIPVALDIRTVENGTPTQKVVPMSKVIKQPEDVFTSEDASKPTTFVFEAPVFLGFRQEHAIVLTSDSDQYKVFISILGQDAIDAAHVGEKISEQPYIGVLFKSQNASTWTPSQFEDLMFKIYRAEFTVPTTSAPSRLVLENAQLGEGNGGYINLAPNAMQFTSGSDEIRVFHSNHGMQSALNYLEVLGVVSEVQDTAINMGSGLTSTGSQITVDDASNFHTTIGGSAVSSSNPGFLRILGDAEDGSEDEIIAYEAINANVIDILGHGASTVTGRNYADGSGSATGKVHADNAIVQCYNIAGIPLTLINTTHSSTTGGIVTVNSPHSYKLKINNKNAGKSINAGGGAMIVSQNVPWDVLTPQIQSQVQPDTEITARVLGTSGTSCGPFPQGVTAETSFVKDTTYSDITLGEENYFPATKLIASQINEVNRMNSVKSFTMELDFTTEKSHLSPVVDLEKAAIITTANVYNNATPSEQIGGECVANYVTKVARLDKSASGLKVMLAANTWTSSTIKVMYKLVPVGYAGSLDDLDFAFFNTDGRPDSGVINPQNDLFTFTDYEYTIEDAQEFDAFQVKISLVGYEQPYIPRVKDFRGIALA